jgi:NAD(P)H dehydrogenase (quinone)
VAGDIDDLLFPVNYGVFWYTGMAALKPHLIHSANHVREEDYARLEADLLARLATLATDTPIPYRAQNGGDYDENLVLRTAPAGEAVGLTATRLRRQP